MLSLVFALAALVFLACWQSALRRNRALAEQIERFNPDLQPIQPALFPKSVATPGELFSMVGDRVHEIVLLHAEVILYANPQLADLLGLDRMALIGRSLSEFVPPNQVDLVSSSLVRGLAGEASPHTL